MGKELLPIKHLTKVDQSILEDQCRRVVSIDWSSEAVFSSGLPKQTIPYWEWEGVRQTAGFKELSEYAFTCLITPSSNANIERIFSIVNATKTKPRNRLAATTLDAIIRIKTSVLNNDGYCTNFKVTQAILEGFTTSTIYSTSAESAGAAELTEGD